MEVDNLIRKAKRNLTRADVVRTSSQNSLCLFDLLLHDGHISAVEVIFLQVSIDKSSCLLSNFSFDDSKRALFPGQKRKNLRINGAWAANFAGFSRGWWRLFNFAALHFVRQNQQNPGLTWGIGTTNELKIYTDFACNMKTLKKFTKTACSNYIILLSD